MTEIQNKDRYSQDCRKSCPALVMFGGRCDVWWLRVLKRKYRHCFAVLCHDDMAILYNPLSHYTEFQVIRNLAYGDIARHYRKEGYEVVETEITVPPGVMAPVGLFSCVEAVKRALGIQRRSIITPWQLRKHMSSMNRKINTEKYTQ